MKEDEVLEEGVFRRGKDNFKAAEKGNFKGEEGDEDEVLEEAVFDRKDGEEEEVSAREAIQAVEEIYKEYKKTYDKSSKHGKAKTIVILLPFAITLILGVVGIIIANIGQMFRLVNIESTGIILIAIGFGGFFMTIVLIAVISGFKGRK